MFNSGKAEELKSKYAQQLKSGAQQDRIISELLDLVSELAAEVLADAAKTLTEKPELIQKARAEFDKRMRGQKYECLIPADVKPHLI